MAEETHLQQLTTELTEFVETDNINFIDLDGKTYVDKDSILSILKQSALTNHSKQSHIHPNKQNKLFKHHLNINNDYKQKEDEYKHKDSSTYDWQSLPIEPTIRFDNSQDANDTKLQDLIDTVTREENHDNLPYIDWTNYALSHLNDKEHETLEYYSNKELFIVLSDYVLIYSKPGDKNGVPRNLKNTNELSIISIVNKYELVLIHTKSRDYTSKCYVKCLLPVKGWIYLPHTTINNWINCDINYNKSDDHLYSKNCHQINMEYIEKNKTNEINNKNIWKQLETNNINHLNFKQQQIVPLMSPLPKFIIENINEENKQINNEIINEEKIQETTSNEGGIKQCLNCIVRWMRAHPFFPGLAITLIQAGIEIVIFFDIITDVIVVYQLSQVTNNLLLSLFFTLSVVFLLSPYMIGWVSCTQWMFRKLQHRKVKEIIDGKQSIFIATIFILFNIAPIGVFTLIIGDIIHLLEYVIVRPIAYLSSCLNYKCCSVKCKLRTVSFEELGYWKLRRVSEIFSESIPQSLVQLLLLLFLSRASDALNLNVFSVIVALISSLIVTLFWVSILIFESQQNGLSFVEYITVVFQGSFKFVPLLPAIERGKKNGINVNWTRYRLDVNGLGIIAKALHNKHCKMKKLKISLYTITNLHRNACKHFGKTLKENLNNLQLIISREENAIKDLFHVYDIDDNWYFDFEEFARCCIVMRKDVQKSVNLYTVSSLFWSLTNTNQNEIYLLDLLLKMGSSKTKIPLLDYDNTLHFATKQCHINLISLLIGINYDKYNQKEFEECVIDSVITQNEKCALTLCEERGVPIVIELICAQLQKICNPFVTVSIGNIEIKSKLLYNTSNPYWHKHNKLLFIIPFSQIDEMMNVNNNKSDKINPKHKINMTQNDYNNESRETSGESQSSYTNIEELIQEEDHILYETEKQIDLLFANKKKKDFDDKMYNKLQLRESVILQQIQGSFDVKHDDDDNSYEQKEKQKPSDIKLEINMNKNRKRIVTDPLSGDGYNATLFAIRQATLRKKKQRRNSLTGTSINNHTLLFDVGENFKYDNIQKQIQRLIVNVKMNNSKIKYNSKQEEYDDEFIGGFKLKIDVSQNILQFHQNIISNDLNIGNSKRKKYQAKYLVSGKVNLKIYLNVLHKYNEYGIRYIDTIQDDS